MSDLPKGSSENFGELEIAWAAGVFAGEGTVEFIERKGGRAPTILRLTTRDQDVVERFREIIGVGRVSAKTPANVNHSVIWQCVVSGQDNIKQVLHTFYPHLGHRQQRIADEALAWRKRKNQHL
jgi:hypothetical protein